MLPGKIPLLAFFTALFIAFIIYAYKSVKPRTTASIDQQSSILIFAKAKRYCHECENNHHKRNEPFVCTIGDFHRLIDMKFGQFGTNYLPEHGNRTAIAKITIADTFGLAPLTVSFNRKNNYDDDENNKLTYGWTVNNQVMSTQPNPTYTNNGIYHTILRVTAAAGKSSIDPVEIKAGNTIPKVTIHTMDNSTFFFDMPTAFRYSVDVQDNGGKEIDRNNFRVTMKYLAKVARDVPLTGFPPTEDYSYGRNLMAANDCRSCHQLVGEATIPSFMQISEKYWDNKDAISFLSNKVITGGSGVWGPQVMNAHPQLSKEDATRIVEYVLSVAVQKPDMEIPQEGTEVLNEHIDEDYGGRYIFTATYTGKSGSLNPFTVSDMVVLRPSKVEAERADVIYEMQKQTTVLSQINNKSYFVLKDIDLKDVRKLTYRYSSKANDAHIEVHTDALAGPVISTATCKTTGAWDKYEEVSVTVTDPGGKHDLYFVFLKNDAPNRNLVWLDWIKFEGGHEVSKQ